MLDARTLFSLSADARPERLRGLPLLASLSGFADAGQVVSQVSEELLETLDSEVVAVFDTDQLIDYRNRRPRITFEEDHFTDYQAPRLELHLLHDGLGEPFLLLAGLEPDLQWERFVRAVTMLIEDLDITLVSWIHSIPMAVPHTRPIGVTVHGNRPALMAGMNAWRPTVQVESTVGYLLEYRLMEAEVGVIGHVIHVPHYLAEAEYPPAAVAALEYLGASAGLMLPTDRLRETGRVVEQQIARQVSGSAEVASVVSSLEENYDERAGSISQRSLLVKENSELVSADELGAEVEAYLASPQAEEESSQLRDSGNGQDSGPTDPTGSPEGH